MAKKAAATAEVPQDVSGKTISVPKMRVGRISLWLIGLTPLVINPWDPVSRAAMLAPQMGAAKRGRIAKDPEAIVNQKARVYMTEDGRYGVPVTMFKSAAVAACRSVQAKMTEARQAFFVNGVNTPIYGSQPVAWESMVRNQTGVADVRFRPVFEEWAVCLDINHDLGLMSEAQLYNLFERAGYGVGVGDWRPEKSASGQCGRFMVAQDQAAVRAFERRIPKVETIRVSLSDETRALLGQPANEEVEELPEAAKKPPKRKQSNGHAIQ